ncbi:MAG: glycoside hydrolase family 9 protein, partial [Oscillospiraceae bacterium]|nr:glycoside hydrolase family 9 protein [Oscillospiraceae bacterium]
MAKKRIAKGVAATLVASALTASAVVPAFAGQQLGATNFNNNVGLPWHICESGANTSLKFEIANGVYKIWILNPGGIDRGGESWWDTQFRHRKISIVASHTYEISYSITASHAGAYKVKIGDFSGSIESWHGDAENHGLGWSAINLTANTKHTYSGTFNPATNPASGEVDHSVDVDAAEWAFQFGGRGEWNMDGDAFPATAWYDQTPSYKTEVLDSTGKERYKSDPACPYLIFDDMSLIDKTNSQNDWGGAVNPYDDATHNAVRVNQIGYYTNLQKKATVVLADGDTKSYQFTVRDSKGDTVYGPKATASGGFDPDSGQQVAVLDFSDFKTAGDGYYIQMESGYTAPAAAGTMETAIGSTRSYPFTISDNLYAEVKPSTGEPVVSNDTTYSDEYSIEKKGDKSKNAVDYTIAGENSLFTNAFNYFYQNRATIDIEGEYITSGDNKTAFPGVGTPSDEDMFNGTLAGKAGLIRTPNLGFDSGYIQTTWVKSYGTVDNVETSSGELTDLDYGWFDAGDCGKYVVNGGISAWTLANTYEMSLRNGTEEELNELCVVPENGGSYNDCLDEVKWELDLFLDMVVESGDAEQQPYIDGDTNGAPMDMTGLVYHKFHDYKWTGLALAPILDGLVRVVKPPSTAATLNAVATFAQGARLFDGAYADTLLAAAEKSYEAAKTVKFQDKYIYAPLDQAIGGG